jgi:hypothetical protein
MQSLENLIALNAFSVVADRILATARAGRAGIPFAGKNSLIVIGLTGPFHLIWRRTLDQ